MNDKELQDLIRLKRYEQPDEDFCEDFLAEFHERRRAELLAGSARSLLVARVKAWFEQLGAWRWAAGAGVAYATVTLILSLGGSHSEPTSLVSTPQPEVSPKLASVEESQIVPVSMVCAQPLDFRAPAMPLRNPAEQLF